MNAKLRGENFTLLPNRDNHNCFGCSPKNHSGLKMEFFSDEKSVASWLKVPEHLCGWNNLVHGGVISTILDEIMSWSAIFLLEKIILTKSMTVDFIKPLYVDSELKAQGNVKEIVNEREATMEGFLYNEKGELCAKAHGTFALFTFEAIKKMKIMDEDVIKDMEKMILNKNVNS